jgi:hypothetical protein
VLVAAAFVLLLTKSARLAQMTSFLACLRALSLSLVVLVPVLVLALALVLTQVAILFG